MEVLYATDGSPSARAAGDLLKKLARRQDLRVDVVGVTSYDVLIPERPVSFVALQERRGQGHAVVEETVADLIDAGFQARGYMVEGTPSDRILALIDELQADVTLLGAGHRTWLANALLGSTSTYVLHRSPTAVLIVHEPPKDVERTGVLMAVDGSLAGNAALAAFASFADPSRCSVDVASVAAHEPPIIYPVPVPYPPVLSSDHRELEEERMVRARHSARDAAAHLHRLGFEVTAEAYLGDPTAILCELAEKGGYGLVVEGSRGLGFLRRLTGASVSDPVARHAPAALVGHTAPAKRKVTTQVAGVVI